MTDLVSRLLEAIEQAERLAKFEDEDGRTHPDSWHTRSCGYGQGELMEDCDCEVSSSVLRRCAADRKIVEFWSLAYSKFSDFPHPEWDRIRSNARWTIRKIAEGYGLSDHQEGEE